MAVVGQFFRTTAMYTAGSNFTHMVASKKKPDHALITHGVYRYADVLEALQQEKMRVYLHVRLFFLCRIGLITLCGRLPTGKEKCTFLYFVALCSISRHPSYMGWFWWSIGTQLLLCNPVVCLLSVHVYDHKGPS